jgi:hypothetical protein
VFVSSVRRRRRRRRLARIADSASVQIDPPSSQIGSSWAVAAAAASVTFTPRALSLSLSVSLSICDDRVSYRSRRPTSGAKAFADLFAGEERPPGIPTPLLFHVCCAKPSSQTLFLF